MTTTNALSLSAHDGYLTAAETDALIRTAQDVPCELVAEPDGTERAIYGSTPDAEKALEALTTAYLPLIHKIARSSSVLDFDDALMVCLEEFLSVIRRYEVGSALPFVAGLSTILSRRIGDVGRTSSLVAVKENAAARYRQLMDKVSWDLEAAYHLCRTTNNGFTPDTFLAVHRAISSPDSLDSPWNSETGSQFTEGAATTSRTRHEAHLADVAPSPEDLTVQAETVRWLFTLVSDRQTQILRLRYGFSDLATENARLRAGFRNDSADLVMSDRQVAQVVGSTTPTVNRERAKALGVMRDALEETEAA